MTQALKAYFRGEWDSLTDEDRERVPVYSRRGLYLMAAFSHGQTRVHILTDGGVTRVVGAGE